MQLPKELTTITPLSKTLAFILFITLPIITYFFGVNYQAMIDGSTQVINNAIPTPSLIIPMKIPSTTSSLGIKNWKTYANDDYGISFKYPQNYNLNVMEQNNSGGLELEISSPKKSQNMQADVYFFVSLSKNHYYNNYNPKDWKVNFRVSGLPAYRYSHKPGPRSMMEVGPYELVSFQKKNNFYTIDMPYNYGNVHMDLFETFLSTFEVH